MLGLWQLEMLIGRRPMSRTLALIMCAHRKFRQLSAMLMCILFSLFVNGCNQTVVLNAPFDLPPDAHSCRENVDLFFYYLLNYSPANASLQLGNARKLSAEKAETIVIHEMEKVPLIAEVNRQSAFVSDTLSFLGRDTRGVLLFELRGRAKKFVGLTAFPSSDFHFRVACRYKGPRENPRAQIVEIEKLKE